MKNKFMHYPLKLLARAWDHINEKFISPEYYAAINLTTSKALAYGDFWRMAIAHSFDIDLCMGKTDVEHEPIFENDIVEVMLNDEITIHKVIFRVEGNYPAYDLEPHIGGDCNSFSEIWESGGEIKILGNIYENPELLENLDE